MMVTLYHGLINYVDTKAKCRHLLAGVYQRLKTGDTVNHVGIFNPALWAVAPLTFSLVSPQKPTAMYIISTNTTCHVRLSDPLWRKAYPIAAQKRKEKVRRNMPSYRIYFHVSYPNICLCDIIHFSAKSHPQLDDILLNI